jgi:hypothetical protein
MYARVLGPVCLYAGSLSSFWHHAELKSARVSCRGFSLMDACERLEEPPLALSCDIVDLFGRNYELGLHAQMIIGNCY